MRQSTILQRISLAVALAASAGVAPGCKDDAGRGGSGVAELKADPPNPVLAGTSPAKTTLTWRTGDGTTGQLYVSTDGRPEKKVAEGHRGKKEIDWIRAGRTYHFKLYQGESHEKVLASVTVQATGTGAGPVAGVRPATGAQPAAVRQAPGGATAAGTAGAAPRTPSGGASSAPTPPTR